MNGLGAVAQDAAPDARGRTLCKWPASSPGNQGSLRNQTGRLIPGGEQNATLALGYWWAASILRGARTAIGLLVGCALALACAACADPDEASQCADRSGATRPGTFLAGWAEAVEEEGIGWQGMPKRIRRLRDGGEMVLIEGGRYWMGHVAEDACVVNDEAPRHRVTLTPFYLDVTEVANAQFLAFVEATGHETDPEVEGRALVFHPTGERDPWREEEGVSWRRPLAAAGRQQDWPRHPVVFVSSDDAIAYCEWVGASLPTEAQYEFVLRQGKESDVFPWGDALPPPPAYGNYMDQTFQAAAGDQETGALANYDDGTLTTAPVGSFSRGCYGTYDISGNVWEWCLDEFVPDYYAYFDGVVSTNPLAGSHGLGRVRRGGGWMTGAGGRLRCSWRGVAARDVCRDYMGFRCAKTVPTEGE